MFNSLSARHFYFVVIVLGILMATNQRQCFAASGDITNLGTLGGSSSMAYGINDAGQVAGESKTTGDAATHGFRYSGGAMGDIGTLGGTNSFGLGINASGQVTGLSNVDSTSHAFRYTGTPGVDGSMADLGTLTVGTLSGGFGINTSGQVTGASGRAFRYTGTPGAGGSMVSLGTLGGTSGSIGYGINTNGDVTGSSWTTGNAAEHAFLYVGTPGAGGVRYDLGTLGGPRSYGRAINDAGQIAGHSNTLTGHSAFRYTGIPGAGGAMTELLPVDRLNGYGLGINEAGYVVGFSANEPGTELATLWQTDAANTGINLDAWLDATNPTLGANWTLKFAYDINNNGLATGYGVFNDGPAGESDGTRAFILDASSLVPEPSAVLPLAVFTLAMGRFRRRKSAAGVIR